jgi:hypothetical protein
MDWLGTGLQLPAAATARKVSASPTANKWCWFDELYSSFYEIDTRIWRAVYIRKRYFIRLGKIYRGLAVDDGGGSGGGSVGSGGDHETGPEENFDAYNDVLECRQCLLQMRREFSTNDKSFETNTRRLVINISCETVATKNATVADAPDPNYVSVDENDDDERDNDNPPTPLPPMRMLDKRTRITVLLNSLAKHLCEVKLQSSRGLLRVEMSQDFKIFCRNLLEVRLSRFRLMLPVRIGSENFLPVVLHNYKILFSRIEMESLAPSSTASSTSHLVIRENFDRAKLLPHEGGTSRSKHRSPSPWNSARKQPPLPELPTTPSPLNTSTTTLNLKLNDYVHWRRDDDQIIEGVTNTPRSRRRGLVAGLISRKSNDIFRYFVLNAKKIDPTGTTSSTTNGTRKLSGYNTIAIQDFSNCLLIFNGSGVKGILMLVRNVHYPSSKPQIVKEELEKIMRNLEEFSFNVAPAADNPRVDPQRDTETNYDKLPPPHQTSSPLPAPPPPPPPPPPKRDGNKLLLHISSNYHNLSYINQLLREATGYEELPFFKRLSEMYEEFRANEKNIDKDRLEKLLNLMQSIYRNIPYIMHQLVILEKYETHDKIVKLL